MKLKSFEDVSNAPGCPRRFLLMRAEAGDMKAPEIEEIRKHVAGCPSCTAFWEKLEGQRNAFLEKHPTGTAVESIMAGAERRIVARRRIFLLAPATAALLILAVFLAWPSPPQPSIRTKGDVSIRFHILRGGQAEPGVSGGIYKEGDRIQFDYTSGANRYLFLVSIDEAGRVSNFNYQGSPASVPITPGGGLPLEGSIILDDSPYPERVFAVFSNRPLDWEDVKQSAVKAWQDVKTSNGSVRVIERLPVDFPQASLLLLKESVRAP